MKSDKLNFNARHGHRLRNDVRFSKPTLSIDEMSTVYQSLMGCGMNQNWFAVYFLEQYIRENKFEYVVELGSCRGALSLYLGNMASATEQFLFHTFEKFKSDAWNSRMMGGGGHWFEKLEKISQYMKSFDLDIFEEEAQEIIKDGINKYKTLIICDNGKKPKEFNLYAPLLRTGDKIIVHDWNEEIFLSDIENTMKAHNIILDESAVKKLVPYKTTLMPFIKVVKP